MNILLIHPYAGSLNHGMQYRPFYLANEWRKLGHKVTIVSASFSHVRSVQPEITKSMTEEEIQGIRYVWLKTRKYNGNGAGRVWHMFEFCFKLHRLRNKIIQLYKPDVVIASSPHPFSIFGAKAIARKSNAKLIFEVRDLWPLTLIELGGKSPWHPFIAFMQYAENYAYRVSDYVVSLLPLAHTYMEKHGLNPSKFHYLPNGIVEEEWSDKEEDAPFAGKEVLQRLKAEGKFLVGYAGAHGLANSLDSLIDSAKLLRNKSVAFILIGKGAVKKELQEKAADAGLTNILFLDSIPKASIPAFLNSMDALFVGLKNEPFYRFGMSLNKLFDYMMATKPIIFAADVGNDPVKEYSCGISVRPEDPAAIAEAIEKLKSLSADERLEMGRRGREAVLAEHNLRNLARDFAHKISGELHGMR